MSWEVGVNVVLMVWVWRICGMSVVVDVYGDDESLVSNGCYLSDGAGRLSHDG